MASEKISAMPSAGALDGTELIPIVQGGTNKKVTLANLLASIFAGLNANCLVIFDGSKFITDSAIQSLGTGTLKVISVVSDNYVCDTGPNEVINTFGDVTGRNVTALTGFTGTGTFTTLQIVGGVIRAAS